MKSACSDVATDFDECDTSQVGTENETKTQGDATMYEVTFTTESGIETSRTVRAGSQIDAIAVIVDEFKLVTITRICGPWSIH